jgi:hypothetical protein
MGIFNFGGNYNIILEGITVFSEGITIFQPARFFLHRRAQRATRRYQGVTKKKCYITFFFKADNTFKRTCTSSTHQPTTQPGLKDKKKASHHAQETT